MEQGSKGHPSTAEHVTGQDSTEHQRHRRNAICGVVGLCFNTHRPGAIPGLGGCSRRMEELRLVILSCWMLGLALLKVADDIWCIKLLSTGINVVGHSRHFKLGLPKLLLKRLAPASLLHHFLPCSPTAATSLTHVKGEKSLSQQEKLKKDKLLVWNSAMKEADFKGTQRKLAAQWECLRSRLHLYLWRKLVTAAALTTALNKGTPKICFIIKRWGLAASKSRKQWGAGEDPVAQPNSSLGAAAARRLLYWVPCLLCSLLSVLHTPVWVANKYPQC